MLQQVADNQQGLDELWYEILRRAEGYRAEPVSEEIRRRGARGEKCVLERERETVRRMVRKMGTEMVKRLCDDLHLGVSDPVEYVRKVTPYEANHDIRTLRFHDGDPRKHYLHWVEVKTTERGVFRASMSRRQSEFALEHPDTTSLVVITGERENDDIIDSDIQEFSSLEDRIRFLHHEVRHSATVETNCIDA